MSELLLGLDIGGTKSAAIVGNRDGEIVDRSSWPSRADRGPLAMLEEIFARAEEMIQRHDGIVAVGAAIGGPLDADRGIVLSPPNLPGWDQIPLRRLLHDRMKLPAQVEHDAAACCLAECRWGAGIGRTRVVYVTCGTGFGAGMVFDGEIYRGAGGQSPEIGHSRFRPDGPEAFGKAGSVEAWCAGASLGKLACWKFPSRWKSPPSSQEIAQLWKSGDADARHIIELNAAATGEVCANIADFLRPDLIILGSLAIHFGAEWVESVRRQFKSEALAGAAPIIPAKLGADLQDCSALVVASLASHP